MFSKKTLKEQKGIIVSDAIISILIILLFAGILTTLIVNIVLETAKIKMNSQHIDLATEVLEYVEKIDYEDVTANNLINYVNNKNMEKVSAGTTTSSVKNSLATYKIAINVETYEPTDGDIANIDIIKIVTITIENSLKNKQYSTTISTLKMATMSEIQQMLEV